MAEASYCPFNTISLNVLHAGYESINISFQVIGLTWLGIELKKILT